MVFLSSLFKKTVVLCSFVN
uniref:Uncharacterized protein n=1 Tax=Arundo donax TaxID=35708 RepID=A0A0A9BS82_ARUDO